jgi:integrase
MLYRLVRPMLRAGSKNVQFVQRIPADLRGKMLGMKLAMPVGDETIPVTITAQMESIRVSLRTGVPAEVKARQAAAVEYVERVFASVRDHRSVELTQRQAVALSGDLYRAWASDQDSRNSISFVQNNDGTISRDYEHNLEVDEAAYASVVSKLDRMKDAGNPGDLEQMFGPLVDRLLLTRGIATIDGPSRRMVLAEFLKALQQGLQVRQRKAGGDYSPDPRSERFPEWQPKAAKASASDVSLNGLVKAWWKESQAAGLSESTNDSYKKVFTALVAFLEHDDATRVTADDVVRFKDHLLSAVQERTGKLLSGKTVKDSYLSALRSVFGWAVTNRKVPSNPAAGITIKLGKKAKVRDTWFSPEETKRILSGALISRSGSRENWQRAALKRWVPWLCAYTGARVGEIVQLRKEDLRHDGERWVVAITPEAGRVKTKERREVPLHRHLVEMGFPAFVQAAPVGHLFMWSGEGRAAWRTAKNRLTAFVRTLVTDANIQPNHAWRHTFKTVGSEAGIQDKVLDAICGHDPRTVGEGYGGVTMLTKARAMDAFPCFVV